MLYTNSTVLFRAWADGLVSTVYLMNHSHLVNGRFFFFQSCVSHTALRFVSSLTGFSEDVGMADGGPL